jgi:hypothetical protein
VKLAAPPKRDSIIRLSWSVEALPIVFSLFCATRLQIVNIRPIVRVHHGIHSIRLHKELLNSLARIANFDARGEFARVLHVSGRD